MKILTDARRIRNIGILLIVAAAGLLYLPFASNPPVFDDGFIYSGVRFSYFATHPLGFGLRVPSYFTLAVTEVLFSNIVAHRIISLVLHIACALVLYKFTYEIARAVLYSHSGATGESSSLRIWA